VDLIHTWLSGAPFGKIGKMAVVNCGETAYVRSVPKYSEVSWTDNQRRVIRRFVIVGKFCQEYKKRFIFPIWRNCPGIYADTTSSWAPTSSLSTLQEISGTCRCCNSQKAVCLPFIIFDRKPTGRDCLWLVEWSRTQQRLTGCPRFVPANPFFRYPI